MVSRQSSPVVSVLSSQVEMDGCTAVSGADVAS